MYFTKVQTLETFKEIYADDLKELFGQKKIKDELFKSHVQSLIEAKLLNTNKVQSWVMIFRINSFLFKFILLKLCLSLMILIIQKLISI